MRKWRTHLVIPDTQVRPGVRIDHLEWIGRYCADKQFDIVVHLGDHFDLPSLCEYDRQSMPKQFHSRRYVDDLAIGESALDRLHAGFATRPGYKPRLVWTEGNHDWRALRLAQTDPRLVDALRTPRQAFAQRGWRVVPYLHPITVDGIAYCHLFCRSSNGRVISTKWGAPNARTQVLREMRSCTAGHKPGLDTHIQPTGDHALRGVIAGSCYQHNEEYMSPQGHNYWRGVLVKHEVRHGDYDLMEVSLDFLKRRYA